MSRAVWLVLAALAQPWAGSAGAQETAETRTWSEQQWGLGFTVRSANIPFATDEKTVATLIPLIMYEGKRVYFYETEGGFKIVENPRWRISAMGRMHFFDIPAELQNEVQGDVVDWGVQVRYKPWGKGYVDFEALSDQDGHASGHVRVGGEFGGQRLVGEAWVDAGFKTSHYNSYFWGLTQEQVNGGVDLGVGAKGYYHLISSLYLQGAIAATYLSRPVRSASLVEDNFHLRGALGFGFSNDRLGPSDRALGITPYWRVAHNWGTPSALGDIIRFDAKPDPFNSQLTSLFYGLPLTDRLFTLPLDVYLHSGAGWHWASDYQPGILELVLSIKLYYTIPLPVRIRLGMAEGISIVNEVPARERENLAAFEPSEYLNYLDPSIDLNLGDLIPWGPLEGVWLGYYIHHRSAIFELAQQFGRIKGGSNFQGIYLQFER